MWIHIPSKALTSAPGLESEAGHSDESDCVGLSATSKKPPTVSNSSCSALPLATSTTDASGTTLPPSTGDRGVDEWISSLEVSPASRGVLQGNSEGPPTSAIFGPRSGGCSCRFVLGSRSLKTFQASLLEEGWSAYCGTLPVSGMTRSGMCYLLQGLEPTTSARGSGLWPTARANDDNRTPEQYQAMIARRGRTVVSSLQVAAQMCPSPVAGDATGGRTTKGKHRQGETGLRQAALMWPTPTVQDGENVSGASRFNRNSLPLNAAVQVSPTGQEATGPNLRLQLNVAFVEWLMGFPQGWTDYAPLATPGCHR